ncbi:uncharacterized protein BKA55DRAFT_598518 [Fusarium redolens]|uniref:Uncharacterized protein n=1 Tax=Fusarium redolens TaxID=48865 RepID=A0A9P9G274_FUSRE|nr:uncharacterized protein BKA55DRAFT_599043 [Fusarium redolens]XP_046043787.1 uncharacterized protein BKA55DRAFT_598518 [Fusarium redolens]KAH7228508.1 hypothetical protein BKA55DRAFT_599043 [Fusarium redolens]KAH7231850.1 hypothetical protein BKA55DRAFT_598518 [Fusarium redolens]
MRGAHLKSFSQSGKSIHKFLQPLSVVHKAKEMQLLTANDDLAQLTGGRPLDDISNMPSDDRRAVLYDMLGDWEDAVAVEMLVRDLTIKVERQDCQCGQLMEYIQRLSYFAKMPQLQKITIEWYTPPKDVDDGLPYDWSTLSSSNSSKGTSLHSVTDDDGTYENEGYNETLRWETSDDDIWSLDGDLGETRLDFIALNNGQMVGKHPATIPRVASITVHFATSLYTNLTLFHRESLDTPKLVKAWIAALVFHGNRAFHRLIMGTTRAKVQSLRAKTMLRTIPAMVVANGRALENAGQEKHNRCSPDADKADGQSYFKEGSIDGRPF